VNVLAIDTSTLHAAVVVRRADGAEFHAPVDPDSRHGRRLIPSIRDMLAEAGLEVSDLGAIAVGTGPGSFTGLRIGLTAAKTLAYVNDTPLVALDSLEVLAWGAPQGALRIAAWVDAQRQDVFTADFARPHPGGPLRRASPTRLESAYATLADLAPGTYLVVAEPLRSRFNWPPDIVLAPAAAAFPDGRALLRLALAALEEGRRDDPWSLEPLYLRRSAAEEKRSSR
jgi:tRNA threonylcarbamoyladenosine biosynthesis protein TsaB